MKHFVTILVVLLLLMAFTPAFAEENKGPTTDATEECGLCHMCSKPLGACMYIWIGGVAVVAVGALIPIAIVQKKKRG